LLKKEQEEIQPKRKQEDAGLEEISRDRSSKKDAETKWQKK
jgi:hypothetical protein